MKNERMNEMTTVKVLAAGINGKSRPVTQKGNASQTPEADQESKMDPKPRKKKSRELRCYRFTIAGHNIRTVEKMAKDTFGKKAVGEVYEIIAPKNIGDLLNKSTGDMLGASAWLDELEEQVKLLNESMPDNVQISELCEQISKWNAALDEVSDSMDEIDLPGVWDIKL